MTDFVFETTPRIICESGAAAKLGDVCAGLGVKKVLVVTDKGLAAAGVIDSALDGLRAAGVESVVFSDVQADPPEESIIAAVNAAKAAGIDGVIGLGGGSSMDTAKLVALLAGNPQSLPDIYGIGLAKGPRLPLIQVPTTAGTGSEVTPIAIVTTPSNEKKGVVSPLLYPDAAVLDGTLTIGLPAKITAMTGIDAMVHAIEAYTSRHKKNPLSDSLAVKALELLFVNIRKVVADGSDAAARNAMLQGSLMAGMSFANAPVAAVHALAYPLGGHFHVPHGHSNALVLVPVLRFNASAAEKEYAELAGVLFPARRFDDQAQACTAFVDAMDALVSEMPFEQRLHQVGVGQDDLVMMARDAFAIQRLLINNPRDVTEADALAVYRAVF